MDMLPYAEDVSSLWAGKGLCVRFSKDWSGGQCAARRLLWLVLRTRQEYRLGRCGNRGGVEPSVSGSASVPHRACLELPVTAVIVFARNRPEKAKTLCLCACDKRRKLVNPAGRKNHGTQGRCPAGKPVSSGMHGPEDAPCVVIRLCAWGRGQDMEPAILSHF